MIDTETPTDQRRDEQTMPGTVDVRRRRLLISSASAPVLLSIASRPAWGSACSPSALASANASGRHDYLVCANKSAGYWKTQQWPSAVSRETLFSVAFNGSMVFGDRSLGAVLNLTGQVHNQLGLSEQLGFHTVGAYVNAHAFPGGDGQLDFGYTPAQIVEIFNVGVVPLHLRAPGFPGTEYDIALFFEYINNRSFF